MEPFGQGDTIGLVLDYDEHKIGISRNAMFLGDLSLKGVREQVPLLPCLAACRCGLDLDYHLPAAMVAPALSPDLLVLIRLYACPAARLPQARSARTWWRR